MNLLCSYWLQGSSNQVEARINEESERAKHYLDPTTEEPIVKVMTCCFWLWRLNEEMHGRKP